MVESSRRWWALGLIALAQFSLASAAPAIAVATRKPVLTTPDSAVRKLRRLLLGMA